MLYLSCIPCSDVSECDSKMEASVFSTTDHRDHDHTSESCSPFCTCACCATSTCYTPFSKLPVSKIVFQRERHLLYNVAFNAEAHYSIWQPPQLS